MLNCCLHVKLPLPSAPYINERLATHFCKLQYGWTSDGSLIKTAQLKNILEGRLETAEMEILADTGESLNPLSDGMGFPHRTGSYFSGLWGRHSFFFGPI